MHLTRVEFKSHSFKSDNASKITYVEECNQKLMEAVDFYSIFILWESMATINFLVTNILQNMFSCVQQKKETHTGLEQVEGK